MVDPAESPHFATRSLTNKTEIVPLYEQSLYREDWIGLKALDDKGGLRLERCPGEHMDLGGQGGCADLLIRKWIGWANDI